MRASANVRSPDGDSPSKAGRAQDRRVEPVRPVGCGDDDDSIVRLEPVHIDQKLVQRLLAFIVASAQTRTAMASDRVDLVDKDDAWRVLFPLLKQVAHAAGTD